MVMKGDYEFIVTQATPRTDAEINKTHAEPIQVAHRSMVEHARSLERDFAALCREVNLERSRGDKEPSGEQVGAAVMAFQDSTKHVKLNITTAQFVLAMVAALEAAANVGGNNALQSDKTIG